MYLERVTLTNFQCYGPTPLTITFDRQLTALLGVNASGKTAACQALLRLFSVVRDQRDLTVDDFHVPEGEDEPPTSRSLQIDAVFAFPELSDDNTDSGSTVPEFFAQMTAEENGTLKLRVVLEATWSAEGGVNGTVDDSRRIVHSLDEDYGDQWVEMRASDRNRIQMVYVPATRDGARQVSAFLRGRLWTAGIWSEDFSSHVSEAAANLSDSFKAEGLVATVTDAITTRWQELHHLSTEQSPIFEPVSRDMSVLVTNAEMLFEPSPTGRTRSARELSDGQQSLLHIAMTGATLDLEAAIAEGLHDDKFDVAAAALPTLTLLAIEEPENNLAPYFLSRVVHQLLGVTTSGRAQALISSHSASVMARIDPTQVRHFRLDGKTSTTRVSEILLPDDTTEAGKYIREAVQAHPELYFARFVVLGEGASEELVIPKLAAARGLHIDQSFVAVVPLGGRHTNHFWRLLNQLAIPHATLLDLDYGRPGGGEGRIRDAVTRLESLGISPFNDSPLIEGFESIDDIDGLTREQIIGWLDHLENWDLFFSSPLDLDFALLQRYPAAYKDHLEVGKTGPSAKGDPRDAVLGDPGVRPDTDFWDSDGAMDLLRWYRYLFLSHSKPSTHLGALSYIPAEKLADPPPRIGKLLTRIEKAVAPS